MTCQRVPGGYVCQTSYSAAYEDAMARLKRGERQLQCGLCGLCCWPDELSGETISSTAYHTLRDAQAGRNPVTVRSPVCKACCSKAALLAVTGETR